MLQHRKRQVCKVAFYEEKKIHLALFQFLSHLLLLFPFTVDNILATRYTLATCGNNHLVKVWSFVVVHPVKQWHPPHSPASGRQSLVPTPELGSPVSPNSLGPRRENSFRIRDNSSPSCLGGSGSFRQRESNENLRRRGSSVRRRHRQCQVSLKLTLEGHGSDLTSVRFNASATRLASSSLDKTVRLWEVRLLR